MNHLGILRQKIGRLRVEIADIQGLNEQLEAGACWRLLKQAGDFTRNEARLPR